MNKPSGRDILTVSQLTDRIIKSLEKGFPTIWVRGEVSDFVRHSSGHWYFTLKDKRAQLRAIMFKYQNIYMRFLPENGMEVVCRGKISGYAQRSIYQIQVEFIEPKGLGALYLQFEQLKKKLDREGLFEEDRKRPIPSPLKRIAVITSSTGAALQDMLRVLRERDPGIEVLIIPARVQGEGAAETLVRALEAANRPAVAKPPGRRPIEALIIGRGGGSFEDLMAFNDEDLARAIAASKIPVICAVGHEVDFTIADFVADLRAPTPTAAAEIAAAGRAERIQRLEHDYYRLEAAALLRLESAEAALDTAHARLKDPSRAILEYMMRADELNDRARRAARAAVTMSRQRLNAHQSVLRARDPRAVHRLHSAKVENLSSRLRAAGRAALDQNGHRLDNVFARLEALSPEATLERGFAIARDREGRVVRDSRAISIGDALDLILWRGGLGVEVKKKKNAPEGSE
jgi:exodeoxyribonuclease VII large subunit